MIDFIVFNLFIGLINMILIFISTQSSAVKITKPNKIQDKVKFLFNDMLIYLCIYLIFSIPLFNVFILIVIIKELSQNYHRVYGGDFIFTKKYLVKTKPGSSNKITTQFIEESVISLVPLVKTRSITEAYKIGKHMITNSLLIENNIILIERSTLIDLNKNSLGSIEILRHTYKIDNNVALLDIYQDKTIPMTVSVNFETENEFNSFIPPIWFGDEITNNEEYKNEYLAIHY